MKVLIVDDHALIRDALGRVLISLVPDATLLEAGEPELAFQTIERHSDLDLILLDLSLPGMHGLTALRSLRAKYPAIAVVVVSATADRESVKQALDSGAMGFIPKSSSNEVMKNALSLVLAGSVYVPPELSGVARQHNPSDASCAKPTHAFGHWSYRETGSNPRTDDGGSVEQADLPRAQPGRVDRQESDQRHIEGSQRDQSNTGSAGSGKAATRTAIDRETFPNDSRTMSLCSDSNFAVRTRQQLCQKSAQLERRYRLM